MGNPCSRLPLRHIFLRVSAAKPCHDPDGGISVFVQVTLERQIDRALETFETAMPEVMECYLMTGDADYLLRVVVSDLTAYERFLHLTRVSGSPASSRASR